jgi:uncharacterized protein
MKLSGLFSSVILAGILFAGSCRQSDIRYDYPISPVHIREVKLTDSYWLPKIQTIQKITINYGFKKCEEEGRMENFLIAGGKMEGTTRGKMPFDDTDLYKIIEGASYSLISSPDPKLENYIDSIIAIIAVGQQDDGYITTWHSIDSTHPPAPWVKPAPRWESEISSHELYNAGHLFEAAAAHYDATGKTNMLKIAEKFADLLVNVFGRGKREAPPGHQIVETGLVQLYRITGKKEYLELAKFFLDVRGDSLTHELYGAYNQDHIPVVRQEEAVGHAVRAVYMYAGMTDIAALYDDDDYRKAIDVLWNNVVTKKMYITGGIGARHEGESFGENYELPNLTAYNETCAAIGNVMWNQRLFMLTGNSKYYDIIERTLYNGLISGISLDGTTFFYPNPLESDAIYNFNQGSCTRASWFDCSCCPTNLIRFIPSVPGLIYAVQADTCFVNLYISNKADLELSGDKVQLTQESSFPWGGAVRLTIDTEQPADFTLKLRIPGWSRNEVLPGDLYSYADEAPETYLVKHNGIPVQTGLKKGYLTLTGNWKKGDIVEINFPMSVRKVQTNEKVAANKGLLALEYGPVVYCIEEKDNPRFDAIKLKTSLEIVPEWNPCLLGGVNLLKGDNFTAVPYYAWSNRGVNRMKVWLESEE